MRKGKESVYLETSVVSYLTNWTSSDLVVAAHQRVTQQWWNKRRGKFELYISGIVLDEISAGDPEASQQRLKIVEGISFIEGSDDAEKLAKGFIEKKALPQKAAQDAVHIAMAAVNGIDYLLTWNCRHIANSEIIRVISVISDSFGYKIPMVCTPLELMGGEEDE